MSVKDKKEDLLHVFEDVEEMLNDGRTVTNYQYLQNLMGNCE